MLQGRKPSMSYEMSIFNTKLSKMHKIRCIYSILYQDTTYTKNGTAGKPASVPYFLPLAWECGESSASDFGDQVA